MVLARDVCDDRVAAGAHERGQAAGQRSGGLHHDPVLGAPAQQVRVPPPHVLFHLQQTAVRGG